MPELRCKPGQLVLVVRASRCEPCSVRVQGLPTTVSHIAGVNNLGDLVREAAEGPLWMLAEPFRCPMGQAGCTGIDRMPDACLRPFDPQSKPEPVQADKPVDATA